MESPVRLERNEAPCSSGDALNKEIAVEEDFAQTPPSPTAADSVRPVKKQTRQWAAWTRQEEESFFNALRQVGKNFEMITCRVQSKNKDQVRHYYYRLVRRMNKLLGPEFCLDARNSKETNAAMLRWWSLLEKYSCKASKLHLKPRRFKIFIEALEHQLLKDRKKNIRKRPSQNENCSSSAPAAPVQNKASGHDTRSVKFVLVDSQNIQKVASGKGSPVKRSVSNGTSRSNNRGDLSTTKTTRQRRKTGGASSAAYKRWEKAAIAGVSLVADAAEHLERTTINKNVLPDQQTPNESFASASVNAQAIDGQSVPVSFGKMSALLSCATPSQPQMTETGTQPSQKLKLQLFPIDEATRKALQKEEHNPHLELTLRAGKKISSILEHLNRKWGKSSIASGELILFPYSAQRDNLVGCQRWTLETVASAADVYASIGSPHIFRLRYGWFSTAELVSVSSGSPMAPFHTQERSMSFNIWNNTAHNADLSAAAAVHDSHPSHDPENLMEPVRDQPTPMMKSNDQIPSFSNFRDGMSEYVTAGAENDLMESSENLANSSWLRNQTGEIMGRQWEDGDNLRTVSGVPLSAGDWADTLTNISVGELLTEASEMDTDGSEPDVSEPPVDRGDPFLEPFSCDSFDAAIAAHIAGRQDKSDLPSVQISHASSILDAEETCDAFSFKMFPAPNPESRKSSSMSAPLATCKQMQPMTSMGFKGLVEEFSGTRTTENFVCEGVPTNDCDTSANETDEPAKDLATLADTYWPDSLGPLDLDMAPSRYQGQDLLLGDSMSLSGLNRLIANSLDAFQNCSFFGLDKVTPTTDGREAAQLLDCKIGSEV